MSNSVTGRLVDGDGNPWPDFLVTVRDDALLRPSELGRSPRTDSSGWFTLSYDDGGDERTLRFRVVDKVGRVLREDTRPDVASNILDMGNLVIRRADARGFLVTLGTGTPTFLSAGNAVSLLVDGSEAFPFVADLIENATSSVLLTQLFLGIPDDFRADPADELPALVLRFEPDLTVQSPRKVGDRDHPDDMRPERFLIRLAQENDQFAAGLLLNRFEVGSFALALPIALTGLGLALLIALKATVEAGALTSVDEVEEYFGRALVPPIQVREFRQSLLNGPMHGKLVIVDGKTAVNLGSPLTQSYFNGPDHAVEDPRRNGGGYPQHDVSIAVVGPAVAHLHEVFRLHWNTADAEAGSVAPIDPPPPRTEGGNGIAAVQVIRTLTRERFADPKDGEKGVLEAYLRAIGNADELIYLENQYLTNEAIEDALIEALRDRDRERLQVILVVNLEPNGFALSLAYSWRQRKLISRLREALPPLDLGDPAARPRLGVFTRWTHDTTAERPRLVPVYLHSKVGIVDDKWATIGSANLDGQSLDSQGVGGFLSLGEARATEVNLLIFNGVDGQPTTPIVDLLRRRLWSEHLGFDETLEGAEHGALRLPPAKGWLSLWQDLADAKAEALRQDPAGRNRCRVLPFPKADETLRKPREHLAALGIDSDELDPLTSVRRFSFEQGEWTGDPIVDPPPKPPMRLR